jgi:hypothetical protein
MSLEFINNPKLVKKKNSYSTIRRRVKESSASLGIVKDKP